MDKTLMLAVAGSGKTTYLINQLIEGKRTLIITYTIANEKNLKDAIQRKFGYIPKGIEVFKYYTFIYGFCVRPILGRKLAINSINWYPNLVRSATGDHRFLDSKGRLYSNRIPALLDKKAVLSDVRTRIEKYFDEVYIDEIQDFGGHDFNFLKTLAKTKVGNLFVGDFYQHTYDTSRDGNLNGKVHENETIFKSQFKAMGLKPDEKTLSNSYRCNPEVCIFVTEKLGINISSHRPGGSQIQVIETTAEADTIYRDQTIVKLFYQSHQSYGCYSKNWGESKGEDHYHDVCVVLNENTWTLFKTGKLLTLAPKTKSKLYVAITRTKGNLYFLPEKLLKSYKKQGSTF